MTHGRSYACTWSKGPQPEIYIIIPLTFPILQAFPPVH